MSPTGSTPEDVVDEDVVDEDVVPEDVVDEDVVPEGLVGVLSSSPHAPTANANGTNISHIIRRFDVGSPDFIFPSILIPLSTC